MNFIKLNTYFAYSSPSRPVGIILKTPVTIADPHESQIVSSSPHTICSIKYFFNLYLIMTRFFIISIYPLLLAFGQPEHHLNKINIKIFLLKVFKFILKTYTKDCTATTRYYLRPKSILSEDSQELFYQHRHI